jgi:hypothetical protein
MIGVTTTGLAGLVVLDAHYVGFLNPSDHKIAIELHWLVQCSFIMHFLKFHGLQHEYLRHYETV